MIEKERIDVLLVKKGFFETREKARAAIMAGNVFVDGRPVTKAGEKVNQDSIIHIKENIMPYVSRGGLKLERALDCFKIDVKDKVAIDVGASTGGFTDCLLKRGAKKVYAVDVGYGQLDWRLRQDPRVICMERINARYLKPEDIGELVDIAVIDVSFISLKLIMPPVKNLLKDYADVVALVKPQFEAGRALVGKKGIVDNPEVHMEVLEDLVSFFKELELSVVTLTYSPIRGQKGNIEFLVHLKKDFIDNFIDQQYIKEIVNQAHRSLK